MASQSSALPVPGEDRAPNLADRVVLIVGAAGGLGEPLAIAAARAGAQVIAAGRQVVKLERLADRVLETGAAEPILYPVDLSGARGADYEMMATSIQGECGRLDAVVHAAAYFGGLTPLVQLGEERWQRSAMVNVQARFLIDQAVFPLLRVADGRIVHVLDRPDRVGRAYWADYGVTQHALRGLLAIEADELEEDGVTAVGFEPPPMRTRLRSAAFVSEEVDRAADPATVAATLLRLVDPALALEPGACYGVG